MKKRKNEVRRGKNIRKIAVYGVMTAIALVLSYIESQVPAFFPIPGMKLGLTTIRQPLDAIAEVAMQTLVSRIKTPDLPPRTILLDAELVVR